METIYDKINNINTELYYDVATAAEDLGVQVDWARVITEVENSGSLFQYSAKRIAEAFAWSLTTEGSLFWLELSDKIQENKKKDRKLGSDIASRVSTPEPEQDLSITIMEEAIALKKRKSKDYQGSQFTQDDYFPFKHQSYLHMLWTKMLRIRSVAEQDEANFESLEDSLIDMINYCGMYASAVRRGKV